LRREKRASQERREVTTKLKETKIFLQELEKHLRKIIISSYVNS